MNLKLTKSKYWDYLPWLGIGLALVGLFAGIISRDWGPIPTGLLVSGGAIAAVWLLSKLSSREFWGQRSTQTNLNLFIAAFAMLLLLGLLNFVVARYPQRLDLSENQIFTLAPQSQQVARKLNAPLKVWLFLNEKDQASQSLLGNYRRLNSKYFSYEFVNPQQQPGLARMFEMKDYGDVYLEFGQRRQFVQNISPQQGGVLSESKLTNAISRLLTNREDRVYFLQGHGEHDLSKLTQARSALEERGYRVESLNLLEQPAQIPTPQPTSQPTPTAEPVPTPESGETPTASATGQPQLTTGATEDLAIPATANLVVISGPQRQLFESELEALERYLDQGGGLMVMLDPDNKVGLEPLLGEWGVTLDNRLVVDPTSQGVGLGATTPLVTNYGNHPITREFGNGISFYPGTQALVVAEKPTVESTPLLLTSEKSWAEKDSQLPEASLDPSRDLKGPLTLGVALNKRGVTDLAKQSRVVVFGNSSFATDAWFAQQLNQDVFVNSVVWLSKRDGEVLSISPRQPTDRRLVLDATRAQIVALLAAILFPLLGFGAAGTLFWKRR